jgi:hypothetical protein
VIKSYFKNAGRGLLRDRQFSFLNLAGLSALLITLLTVSFQAIKAALTNPIRSLRTE